jgi:oligoendopeptidase F
MLKIRAAIAAEAGFPSFTEYAYRVRERFDYGVAEATSFQNAIEATVIPLARALNARRQEQLKLDTLRPWDTSVDPLNRPPLRPFSDPESFALRTEDVFRAVDPELGDQFAFLRAHDLLDLANRQGKAPGGYQTSLEADRLPFIFMNAVGLDGDVRTLLHEGGHAFHSLASRREPLAAYRDAPIEFCEVASMAMELLGARDTAIFYNEEDAERSYRQLLEGIIHIFPWIATVDAFQHWVYANPNHDRADRRDAWVEIAKRFGVGIDWTGHEEVRANSWHRQLHIFLYPVYYIEYGIAELGALGVWRRSRADREAAIADYRAALALGGSKPLPDLFRAAGLEFDFSERTLAPLMRELARELDL